MAYSELPGAAPPRRHSAKFLIAAAVGMMVVLVVVTVSTTRRSPEVPLETTTTALASTCTGTTTGQCLFFCFAWTNAECKDGQCQCREGSCNVDGSGVCAPQAKQVHTCALTRMQMNPSAICSFVVQNAVKSSTKLFIHTAGSRRYLTCVVDGFVQGSSHWQPS